MLFVVGDWLFPEQLGRVGPVSTVVEPVFAVAGTHPRAVRGQVRGLPELPKFQLTEECLVEEVTDRFCVALFLWYNSASASPTALTPSTSGGSFMSHLSV
jgi:hypothetical protein